MFNIYCVSSARDVDLALARRCAAHLSSVAAVIVYSVRAFGGVPLGHQCTVALLLTGMQP